MVRKDTVFIPWSNCSKEWKPSYVRGEFDHTNKYPLCVQGDLGSNVVAIELTSWRKC